MLTKTKLALAAALVLSATLSASAATKPRVAHGDQAAAATYDAIPGYDKDGNTVGIPNPERSQSQR
jgi:hypothetical protein